MAFFEDLFGSLFEDGLKGTVLGGLAVGVGAMILAPVLLPALKKVARPMVKGAISGGMAACRKGRELVADASEGLEDIVAEVKAEMAESREADAAGFAPVHDTTRPS